MYVIYWIYSVAGWIALVLFLVYWAGVSRGRKLVVRDSQPLVGSAVRNDVLSNDAAAPEDHL